MNRHHSERIIAALLTCVLSAVILLILFFTGLTWDRAALARMSIPEEESDEEIFIEPELLELPGEELPEITESEEREAPADKGEPEQAPEVNREIESPGKNEAVEAPKPAKVVTQSKPSPVKVTEPKKSEKEPKRATDPTAGKFGPKNGVKDGKNKGQGTGQQGTAKVKGSVRGRDFRPGPSFTAEVSQRTVVVVSVTVNSAGKVTYARVSNSGGASGKVQEQCRQNAYKARWTEKQGAPDANGTITYTITPRI